MMPAGTEFRYPYHPSPRQQQFHACPAEEVMYGGAAGGGKSDALIAAGVYACLMVPGAKVILFRRSFPELKQEILPRMLERLEGIAQYKAADNAFYFPNGSIFRLGYMESDRDVTRYQGPEYILVLWDELTHFTRYQYTYMRSRLRAAGRVGERMKELGWKPRMLSGTNPGGPGHGWVKRMFYDPYPAGNKMFLGGIEPGQDEAGLLTLAYIPAKATDNPHLDQRTYNRRLSSLDPTLARALRDGDWDILEGVRFPQFRRGLHVIEPEQLPVPIIGYPRVVGVDYGLSAPFAALWMALLPDDLVVVYREAGGTNLTADQQARIIAEAEAPGERMPGRPLPVALDPSCWARSHDQVEKELGPDLPAKGSIAWWYRQVFGAALKPARNDRVAGWHLVDRHLNVPEGATLPRVLIYSTCMNLIRTLPEMQRDPKHPEDILASPKQDDHWCFVAGTQVRTSTGDQPIERVRVGDWALTPAGYRRVLAAGMTSAAAAVGRVTFSDGSALVGTGDHPVYLANGTRVRLDALRYGDTMDTCPPPQTSSPTGASCSADTRIRRTGPSGPTSLPAVTTGSGALVASTRRSGRTSTGQSRMGITSTTPTTTRSTTTRRTSSYSAVVTTNRTTGRTRRALRSADGTSRSPESRRRNGTAATRVGLGTPLMGGPPGRGGKPARRYANSAARPTAPASRAGTASARTTARHRHDANLELTTRRAFAAPAVMSSSSTGTPAPRPAPVRVVRPFVSGLPAPVFNLTVDDAHRYYANGILVSNCDAFRYGLMELVGGGHDRSHHDTAVPAYAGTQARDAALDMGLTRPKPPGPGELTRRRQRARFNGGGPGVGGTDF